MKRVHGISLADWDAMYAAQEGKCGICQRDLETVKRLVTDHNHRTNKVRGLLCSGCNTAIGLFQESTAALRSAIEYLEKHT